MALSRASQAIVQRIWGDPEKSDARSGVGGRETLAATGYSRPAALPKSGGRYGLHLQWDATAAPNGTFTIQYSGLPSPDESTDNDWVTDTTVVVLGTSLTVAGAAGNTMIIAGNIPPGGWVRVKWTRTSGSLDVAGYISNAGHNG